VSAKRREASASPGSAPSPSLKFNQADGTFDTTSYIVTIPKARIDYLNLVIRYVYSDTSRRQELKIIDKT
jgi:hypothetical protein